MPILSYDCWKQMVRQRGSGELFSKQTLSFLSAISYSYLLKSNANLLLSIVHDTPENWHIKISKSSFLIYTFKSVFVWSFLCGIWKTIIQYIQSAYNRFKTSIIIEHDWMWIISLVNWRRLFSFFDFWYFITLPKYCVNQLHITATCITFNIEH